ncbi:MAG TPA: hypothetical protein VK674_03990 [Candidatus Limnocylindria bacterium]|nr:hypothetical protein [Candidatus Limnocylindria bacterium]
MTDTLLTPTERASDEQDLILGPPLPKRHQVLERGGWELVVRYCPAAGGTKLPHDKVQAGLIMGALDLERVSSESGLWREAWYVNPKQPQLAEACAVAENICMVVQSMGELVTNVEFGPQFKAL